MSDIERNLKAEIIELVNSGLVFSDIHIEEDAAVMVKTPAGLELAPNFLPVSRDDLVPTLESFDSDWAEKIKTRALNFLVALTNCRLRLSAYLTSRGTKINLVIRKIPLLPMKLKDTGLPESLRLLLEHSNGLILLNGSTGSGKSTSLAALVDAINEKRSGHIVTIEDPIEFTFARQKCIFSQREIGVDVESFFQGAKDALRQRPDVIVIGEIRDRDTAETALLAAESGVLVIGTLHSNGAQQGIQKMLSYFTSIERESKVATLQNVLLGVISHQLLPAASHQGWVLAPEIIFNNKQQISKQIGNSDDLARVMERGDCKLSQTLSESLTKLLQAGKIRKVDALRAMTGPGQAVFMERTKQIN